MLCWNSACLSLVDEQSKDLTIIVDVQILTKAMWQLRCVYRIHAGFQTGQLPDVQSLLDIDSYKND